MQHDTSPHRVTFAPDRQARHPAVRRPGAGLLAPAVHPILSAVHPLRGQGVPARGGSLHGGRLPGLHHRQHQRPARRRRRCRRRHRTGDGRLRPHPGLPVPRAPGGQPRSQRPDRAAVRLCRDEFPGRPRASPISTTSTARRSPGAATSPTASPSGRSACRPTPPIVIEQPHLVPLPDVLPPVYELLERVVDLHGYVSVDTNRYSVPERYVGKSVAVYQAAGRDPGLPQGHHDRRPPPADRSARCQEHPARSSYHPGTAGPRHGGRGSVAARPSSQPRPLHRRSQAARQRRATGGPCAG